MFIFFFATFVSLRCFKNVIFGKKLEYVFQFFYRKIFLDFFEATFSQKVFWYFEFWKVIYWTYPSKVIWKLSIHYYEQLLGKTICSQMDSSQSWFSLCIRGWGWTLRIQKSKYIFKLSTSSQPTFILVPNPPGWYPRRRPTPCPWGGGWTQSKNTSKWSAHQSKQLLFWSQACQGDTHGGGLPHAHGVEVGRGQKLCQNDPDIKPNNFCFGSEALRVIPTEEASTASTLVTWPKWPATLWRKNEKLKYKNRV